MPDFDLKPLHKDSIPAALDKGTRYRLFNESFAAESICLDILEIDPENQQALVLLLLAMTDQFLEGYSVSNKQVQEVLNRIGNDYERTYYSGIAREKRAKAQLNKNSPGSNFVAYELFRDAMDCYDRAIPMRSEANDDAILRWNTCARLIMRHKLLAKEEDKTISLLE
jgi:hypothetical protein